jgi:23S rRNA pseudouridine1911/1915/1917 synthase
MVTRESDCRDQVGLSTFDSVSAPAIIYEDNSILAVDKPAGWSIMDKAAGAEAHSLMPFLQQRHGKHIINAHRIDRDVSGVVLCAKTKTALDSLSGEFQSKMAHRVYHGLVVMPQTDEEAARITEFPLVRAAGGGLPTDFEIRYGLGPDLNVPGRMHVYRRRGGKPAVSQIKVIEDFGRFIWIEGRPETSREQQLQAHLAAIGAPVLGDASHGLLDVKLMLSGLKRGYKGRESEKPMIDRLGLHLSEITLRHPETKESITIEAPLPRSFEIALKNLRKFRRR